jgi:hypothetical protein
MPQAAPPLGENPQRARRSSAKSGQAVQILVFWADRLAAGSVRNILYRVCVIITITPASQLIKIVSAVVVANKKVLLLQRDDNPEIRDSNCWQLPDHLL